MRGGYPGTTHPITVADISRDQPIPLLNNRLDDPVGPQVER